MLSVPAALVAALEDQAPLIAPSWVFALIAFAIFVTLGFVTWSFRDVANRQDPKPGSHTGHDHTSDHH